LYIFSQIKFQTSYARDASNDYQFLKSFFHRFSDFKTWLLSS